MINTNEITKMRLSVENVKQVLTSCLYVSTTPEICEIHSEPVVIQGIANSFQFDQQLLAKEKQHIEELLEDLPDTFKLGNSFIEMYTNRDGKQWTGVIPPLEELLALGIAIGKIEFILPREQWWALSGGMPYIKLQ